MTQSLRQMELKEKDFFDQYLDLVDIRQEKIIVSDGAVIELVIYKPRALGLSYAPAYIYAHGGGAFAFRARDFNNIMSVSCINLNCVVISVDFRNGPEVKCPRGQQDFADAVHHVMNNPTKYRINTNKVCLAGISGGGWIVVGAANLMAKEDKLSKIKALFIHTGMLSDECGRMPEDQLEVYERDWGQHSRVMSGIYKLHAINYNAQINDDQL